MSKMFSYKMEGFDELKGALEALPERMEKQVFAGGVRKGANHIRDAVKERIPEEGEPKHPKYGHGRDNIRVSLQLSGKGFARYVVHNGAAFWLLIREFGSKRQPARPAMRSAFDESAEGAIAIIIKEWVDGLEHVATKLASDYKTAAKALGVKSK